MDHGIWIFKSGSGSDLSSTTDPTKPPGYGSANLATNPNKLNLNSSGLQKFFTGITLI